MKTYTCTKCGSTCHTDAGHAKIHDIIIQDMAVGGSGRGILIHGQSSASTVTVCPTCQEPRPKEIVDDNCPNRP